MSFWLAHSSNESDLGTIMDTLRKKAEKTYCGTWAYRIKDAWLPLKGLLSSGPVQTGQTPAMKALAGTDSDYSEEAASELDDENFPTRETTHWMKNTDDQDRSVVCDLAPSKKHGWPAGSKNRK